MRLAFLGTPSFSVPTLRSLVDAGHEVALVVTQADKKRGRGGELVATPVKRAAVELGIPVTSRVADVLDAGVDYGVVVAFGRILKAEVLDRLTFINLHPSLLPRWRGATPVESAILAGDSRTGVCVMKLEMEMDAGPIYARAEVDIDPSETAAQLLDRLFALGTDLLLEELSQGVGSPVPQVGEPTYSKKITPEDLRIDWSKSAVEISRLTRIGRAWTIFRGRRFLVLEAAVDSGGPSLGPGELDGVLAGTGDGALQLLRVQPEGKGPTDAQAWANGARLVAGADHFER